MPCEGGDTSLSTRTAAAFDVQCVGVRRRSRGKCTRQERLNVLVMAHERGLLIWCAYVHGLDAPVCLQWAMGAGALRLGDCAEGYLRSRLEADSMRGWLFT